MSSEKTGDKPKVETEVEKSAKPPREKGEKGGKGGKGEKSAKGPKGPKGGKGEGEGKTEDEGKAEGKAGPKLPEPKGRLREMYEKDVVPKMMAEFHYKNRMQVPRLHKIVINMGLGEALQNPKIIDSAVEQIAAITGQKPVVTKSRKAIANFKLRAGLSIGCMVTLRRARMWEFFDRFVNVAIPRVRDFKGISGRSFDGKGNFTAGIREQIIFPEINFDKIEKIKGLNITVVTTATNDEEARALLTYMGMPFRK
jgi:large subunit ribosomal protein L5